eukprot:TRINITY_DN2511_c0_g1_i1.p1 TRINITY_DN2511_c0_g1~~TRINITY_DN2511_c0_g1_i1.p1  ORF type:complete len:121 (-),score=2.99 TRINITY_DN2511_c0_g1_i1:752-1114(-)
MYAGALLKLMFELESWTVAMVPGAAVIYMNNIHAVSNRAGGNELAMLCAALLSQPGYVLRLKRKHWCASTQQQRREGSVVFTTLDGQRAEPLPVNATVPEDDRNRRPLAQAWWCCSAVAG